MAFVATAYTVSESEGEVEVCVNLTQPQRDILDETISVNVYNDDSSSYIPIDAILASKTVQIPNIILYSSINCVVSAPDSPNFLGEYSMVSMTDYEQQTLAVNYMKNTPITETTRLICYNQTIYDDRRVEPVEYIGLTMAIRTSTVMTIVDPAYGQTSIKITNSDSTFSLHNMCT